MKKTLVLKRETLAELGSSDLLLVRGAADVPPPTYDGTVCDVVRTVKNVVATVTSLVTTFGITDLCN